MTKLTDQKASTTARTRAEEIVEELRDLAATLQAGQPLESRFTVRTYKIAPPPKYDGALGVRVQELLAMSQAAFAPFSRRRPIDRAVLGATTSSAQSAGVPTLVRDRGRPGPLAQAARGVPGRQ